ncbi:hypothetical protein KBY96_14470 [Cyanobium sp. ATX 6A2]|uniref:hypothetical protein n=1 Tax=Cyanobium sp. ATX 6A2 TaxID=2823700 RepID=UPI0020CE424B|nr:hypothetical protein [Cyanobium sp. ATX 6A2]MCP9889127.1 hypothetical protein [Cyanobium sp. ATX 6A2]
MPRLFATLPVVAALVLVGGCGPAAEQDDRSAYNELDSPAGPDQVTADPKQMALELFGSAEPVEGSFSESVVTVVESETQTVVKLTQTGLADDSVEGKRYRLDFVPAGENWQLEWVGDQQRCREGRGPQEWTTERCL